MTKSYDTTTSEGFRQALEDLNMIDKLPRLARLINSNERTLRRYIGGSIPPHPTAAAMLTALINGYRPRDWHMSGDQMKAVRTKLGLTVEQMAEVLDVEDDTVLKYESDFHGPPGVVAKFIQWIEDGYRPPNWPQTEATGDLGEALR